MYLSISKPSFLTSPAFPCLYSSQMPPLFTENAIVLPGFGRRHESICCVDAAPWDKQVTNHRNSPAFCCDCHPSFCFRHSEMHRSEHLNETLPYVPIVNVLSVSHVCLKENLDAALPLFLDESVFSTVWISMPYPHLLWEAAVGLSEQSSHAITALSRSEI